MPMIKIVDKVIYPIVTQTKTVAGFYIGAIARQKNSYGVVTDIDPESYRPVTINWDKNEPSTYTEDELRVLKIEVVEQLLPSERSANNALLQDIKALHCYAQKFAELVLPQDSPTRHV